jgi:hypothetical protein
MHPRTFQQAGVARAFFGETYGLGEMDSRKTMDVCGTLEHSKG